MSYFLALRVDETHLNPWGLKPISRMLYPTKKEANVAAFGMNMMSSSTILVVDADHEPGRSVISKIPGP